jgi:hypothetical protein
MYVVQQAGLKEKFNASTLLLTLCPIATTTYHHRDKPRVCMPAKNVSTFAINIFYYFHLWAPLFVLTQSKETVS